MCSKRCLLDTAELDTHAKLTGQPHVQKPLCCKSAWTPSCGVQRPSTAASCRMMPGILCGPRGIYPPSLEQPFLPPLLTEGPCAAATCRCPAGRGGYDPSAADLCRAVESKPGPAHYAAVVWLHLCSCQTLHVPAPPCQMGGSAVQHLVEASAMGRRCGLQKEPGLVVLAGCNRGCH